MAYTTIDDPSAYFQNVLWTGDGTSGRSITLDGNSDMQPDFVWYKSRSNTYNHGLFDSVRGVSKFLKSNSTDAETTLSGVSAFNSDGFSVGSDAGSNGSGATFVAWNWKASGSTASNTDGSITSTVSANTTAGFSIVSYTGTSSTATVGHGLGVTPSMIIVKNRSATQNWIVYHQAIGNTGAIYLNASNATNTASGWFNNTSPTSSVFTVGTYDAINGSSHNLIAYCFTEKQGYSKFGSYIGNGNANGTFIYTGFKPAYFLTKSSSNGESWHIFDNKRQNSYNPHSTIAPRANDTSTESTNSNYDMDFLSNGVKWKGLGDGVNASGYTYIYMAFAESPFVTSTGIPTTAG